MDHLEKYLLIRELFKNRLNNHDFILYYWFQFEYAICSIFSHKMPAPLLI